MINEPMNDFLDNIASNDYRKIKHKNNNPSIFDRWRSEDQYRKEQKEKKKFEVDFKSDRIGDIDYMSDIDDQYSHHFNNYEENVKDDCEE